MLKRFFIGLIILSTLTAEGSSFLQDGMKAVLAGKKDAFRVNRMNAVGGTKENADSSVGSTDILLNVKMSAVFQHGLFIQNMPNPQHKKSGFDLNESGAYLCFNKESIAPTARMFFLQDRRILIGYSDSSPPQIGLFA